MNVARPSAATGPAGAGGFAYAQARIQARFALLPTEADWQRMGSLRRLSAWLEEARNGALKPWIKGFSAQSGSDDIERGVRALFLDAVDDTARVVPGPWRDAVHWCRWLALVPLFEHLAAGRPAPAWVSTDFRLAALFGPDGGAAGPLPESERLRALGLGGLLAPGTDGVARHWRAQWLARWPTARGTGAVRLRRLVARVDGHLAGFGAAPPSQAWPLRRRLRESLRLDFHRHLLQPATAFLYLALVALDLERLRRALLDRALYSPDAHTPLAADPDAPAAPTTAEAA